MADAVAYRTSARPGDHHRRLAGCGGHHCRTGHRGRRDRPGRARVADLSGHSAVLRHAAGHRFHSVDRAGGSARRHPGADSAAAHAVDEASGVTFLFDVLAWLMAPEHWVGSDGIPNRIAEHLLLSAVT